MQTQNLTDSSFVPYFQAIYSVEDQSVVAYDSFEWIDENIDKTLQAFSKAKEKESLFINLTPDQLLAQVENATGLNFPIVKKIQEFQIPASKICIEISERTCVRGLDSLSTAVEILKELGFKIALGDVGSESSNLERLGTLKPAIIKINLNLLKQAIRSLEFQSILEYLKDIALGLGSELLFEGIESETELHRAVDSGARYLQGNLLGMPSAQFIPAVQSKDFLTPLLESFHNEKRKSISKEIDFEIQIRNLLANLQISIMKRDGRILIDAHSIFKLMPAIRRVYVTDWAGTQVSPYYEKEGSSGFKENMQNLNKNWSYLPFFYRHVKQVFRNRDTWQISEPYYDHALKERIVVFSKILEEQYSIFIDISYGN
jgi:EAL domain-containing protein (putative c-di-GMP-specific phosphodiesterase class I)